MCSRSLNKLAQPLPMAHCANSRLVCKISGDVMNENNPPMMLPNGYVYGYNVRGNNVQGQRSGAGHTGAVVDLVDLTVSASCLLSALGAVPGYGSLCAGSLAPRCPWRARLVVKKLQDQGSQTGRPPGGSVRREAEPSCSGGWVGGRPGEVWPLCPHVHVPPALVVFQSLLSIRQDDKVVCPRTKEVFHFSQAEKVYIM